MKKIFTIITTISLLLLASSCKKGEPVDILGKWQSNISMVSELGKSDNPADTIANVHIKQENTFTFLESGKFIRTVSQKVESVESFSPDYPPEALMEQFGKNETKLEIHGNYEASTAGLKVDNYEVVIGDQTMSYDDYYELDKSQGPAESTVSLRKEEDLLYIGDVKFKKIQ